MTIGQAVMTLLVVLVALLVFAGRAEVQVRLRRLARRTATWLRYRGGLKLSRGKSSKSEFTDSLVAVSCTLGIRSEEEGARGLKYFPFEAQDGGCDLVDAIENQGRITNNKARQHYFYFRFVPEVVELFRGRLIYIIVEYHDGAPLNNDVEQENLMLAYDAVGDYHISTRFKSLELPLLGDDQWKVSVFSLSDGNFEGRGNGADFRICIARVNSSKQRELTVRQVTVVRAE